ncbi:MAG TPA: hypothetical protein QF804_01515, partial [Rhodospirillales bacterium]|nr:hypothetical protein [Rhodospirillales bacterium]
PLVTLDCREIRDRATRANGGRSVVALRAIFLVVTVLVFSVLSGTVSAQTLEEELSGLLVDNPQLLAVEKTIESTAKEIDKALAGYMPILQVTAEIGPE